MRRPFIRKASKLTDTISISTNVLTRREKWEDGFHKGGKDISWRKSHIWPWLLNAFIALMLLLGSETLGWKHSCLERTDHYSGEKAAFTVPPVDASPSIILQQLVSYLVSWQKSGRKLARSELPSSPGHKLCFLKTFTDILKIITQPTNCPSLKEALR